MSKTLRRDHYEDTKKKVGDQIFLGQVITNDDDANEKWKMFRDKKKWYKPSKKQKNGYLSKLRTARRVDMKKAMMHPDEDGEIVLPVEKKTDVWYYN